MKPRIGIAACFFHADPKRPIFKGRTLLYLEEMLAHWILSQGAPAYLIPSRPSQIPSFEEIAADFDGLVLQGGSDLSPESYGEKPMRPEWNGDRVRDLYEMELIRTFRAQGKPILGVCRGAQILNVALGGTMYQDIATQVKGARVHRDWQIYDDNQHEIRIEPGSGLAKIYPGLGTAVVNSVHHQGIKDLASELVVEAYSSSDQIIEAIRARTGPYLFGVQWHPEWHPETDLLNSAPILEEFLRECHQSRKR